MAARRSSRTLACLVLAAAAAVAAWTGSAALVPMEARRAAAGAAVVAALLGQQVQPAVAKDVLLTASADPSERIAAPMIDNSNLVKGVPFAGENAPRYAPQVAQSEDDLLFKGNNGINVLEYVRAKNGWVGQMQFDSAAEEASANKLLEKLR
ncbi:unnamed protein product [Prorocentrum cordatum]|uniref:PS II complex 12 kDa extrinsic protein n=1 Tax=Prorocentrum cordatum TaxID=2364126 RepID=A0ABN9T5B4_9DINO|nr:unnamed protein product [Polarella glacialis]